MKQNVRFAQGGCHSAFSALIRSLLRSDAAARRSIILGFWAWRQRYVWVYKRSDWIPVLWHAPSWVQYQTQTLPSSPGTGSARSQVMSQFTQHTHPIRKPDRIVQFLSHRRAASANNQASGTRCNIEQVLETPTLEQSHRLFLDPIERFHSSSFGTTECLPVIPDRHHLRTAVDIPQAFQRTHLPFEVSSEC